MFQYKLDERFIIISTGVKRRYGRRRVCLVFTPALNTRQLYFPRKTDTGCVFHSFAKFYISDMMKQTASCQYVVSKWHKDDRTTRIALRVKFEVSVSSTSRYYFNSLLYLVRLCKLNYSKDIIICQTFTPITSF